MSAAELLLARLGDPKPSGRDRWRARCPVCGGRSRSSLSIGVGAEGQVLLHCFKAECPIESIAAAVGLDVFDLFPERGSTGAPLPRRRLLSAAQALDLLDSEATTVWIVASDIARGKTIDEETLKRIVTAAGRIGALRQEVNA